MAINYGAPVTRPTRLYVDTLRGPHRVCRLGRGLLSPLGIPRSQPPWGIISAIDLDTGELPLAATIRRSGGYIPRQVGGHQNLGAAGRGEAIWCSSARPRRYVPRD